MAIGNVVKVGQYKIVPCSDSDGWYAEILDGEGELVKTILDSENEAHQAIRAAREWLERTGRINSSGVLTTA